MPKRSSKSKSATAVKAVISSPTALSQIMAEMGRRGGRIGGKRRLETLSDERRKQIASDAAKARWEAVAKRRKKTA